MPLLIIAAILGAGAIVYGVRKVRGASPNNKIIEHAKEEILLATFERWDQAGVGQEERVTRLQELSAKGRLPGYVEDVSDPDAVRALVTERADSTDG